MAEEGFQGYHVRQQSRRDNLRATLQNNNPQPPNNSLFTPTLTMTSAPTTAATGFSFHSHAPTSDPPFVLPLFSDSHDYDAVSLHTELIRSSAPLGPFTGYASILKRSRYLNPAQQLLEDFCRPGRSDSDPPRPNYLNRSAKDPINSSDRLDVQLKNSRLTLMLEEVYKRYKLYCQQMELAVASFETIDGLGNAAPYISFAIKSILKHFGCLKNAILDRLQSKAEKTSYDDDFTQNPNGLNLSNKNLRQSVLRPQRGLPENAVAVLRAWLFEHFLHPYPSDSEKQMLAQQTGLSRTQVSNWFINSRVRIWKPMVEEIHGLETQQAQTTCLYDNPLHLGLTTSSRNARDTQEKCSNNNEHRNFSEQSDDRMMQRGNTGYHGSLTISNDLESHEVSLALSLQAKK